MALPTSTGRDWAPTTSMPFFSPAYLGKNGALYVLLPDDNDNLIYPMKATDPTTSWAAQTATSDPGSQPDTIVTRKHRDRLLYAAAIAGANEGIDFGVWDMSSDSWTREGIQVTQNALRLVDMGIRSDGDIIIVYQGNPDKIHGVDYNRVDYAVSTNDGATWSSDHKLDTATTSDEIHYEDPQIVIDDEDRGSCIFIDRGGDVILWRGIAADNNGGGTLYPNSATINTSVFVDVTGGVLGFGDGLYRNGTFKIRFPFDGNSIGIWSLEFDSSSSPAFSVSRIHSVRPHLTGTDFSIKANITGINDEFHCLWVDISWLHVNHNRDGGTNSWSTKITVESATTTYLAGIGFDRSGPKIGYIFFTGSTAKYNEIDSVHISVSSLSFVDFANVTPRAGPFEV